MTGERLQAMKHFINRFGSGNGWTGTVGEAATMIHELLKELELRDAELRCYRLQYPGWAFNAKLLCLHSVEPDDDGW